MITPARLRIVIILAALVLLEVACRTGFIGRFALVPPSEMVTGLFAALSSGKFNGQIALTLSSIAVAASGSIVLGFLIGVLLHASPRARDAVDPYLAAFYAVPLFVFYPTFIMLFGLNRIPVILIGLLKGMVVVIINTLDGLDRVPKVQVKAARVLKVSRRDMVMRVILPSAFPYFLTGAKFAIAYAILGVLGSEFILANKGIGYEISYAFNDFNNPLMYSLILFVLAVTALINAAVYAWERRVLKRRGMA